MTTAAERPPVSWTIFSLTVFGTLLTLMSVFAPAVATNASIDLGAAVFVPLSVSCIASAIFTGWWINYGIRSLSSAVSGHLETRSQPRGIPDYPKIARLEAEIYADEFTTVEKLRHVRQGVWNEIAAMCNRSSTPTANFTRQEADRYDELSEQIDQLDRRIKHVIDVENRINSRG